MRSHGRTDQMFLQDIKTAMVKISNYIQGMDFSRFENDEKTIDAVVRNFEIIGEASKNLSQNLKQKYPSLPWSEMYYLRNRVSHEYFGVDIEIIWDIATQKLPLNLLEIQKILNE